MSFLWWVGYRSFRWAARCCSRSFNSWIFSRIRLTRAGICWAVFSSFLVSVICLVSSSFSVWRASHSVGSRQRRRRLRHLVRRASRSVSFCSCSDVKAATSLCGIQRMPFQKMQLLFNFRPAAVILPHGRMRWAVVGCCGGQLAQQIAVIQVGTVDAERFHDGLAEVLTQLLIMGNAPAG